jgi:hypothetical protein
VKPSPRQLKRRCPCGSGKAFKNSHGKDLVAPELVRMMPKEIRVPRYPEEEDYFFKAPGYNYTTFAFLYEGEDEPRTSVMGEPGKYEVNFTLLQPGQAAEKLADPTDTSRVVDIQNEKIAGDSHLALCMPEAAPTSADDETGVVVPISVNRQDGSADDVEIILKPNQHGRLHKVFVRLQAKDFSDAERRAYFEASTLLSDLAFQLDIPLHVAHTYVKETKTKHARVGFKRQFGYKSIANLPEYESAQGGFRLAMKPDPYPALTSIYREALNSESPYYQFLCFCRVIQRLKEKLRPRWEKTILAHDKDLLPAYRKRERFPEDSHEAERFPDHVKGKKFYKVFDDHLRPLRNGVGHIFLEDMDDESSAERSTDEYDFVSEVYSHLPVAHHIARAMLMNDFGPGGLVQVVFSLKGNGQ